MPCNRLLQEVPDEIHYDSISVLGRSFDSDWCVAWRSLDRVLSLQCFGRWSEGRLSFCGVRRFLCSDAEGIVVHGETSITSSSLQEPDFKFTPASLLEFNTNWTPTAPYTGLLSGMATRRRQCETVGLNLNHSTPPRANSTSSNKPLWLALLKIRKAS